MKTKIKLIDRVLLALYALVGIVITLTLTYALANGMQVAMFGYAIQLNDGVWTKVLLAALCALVLIWSVRLLMLAFRREPKIDKSSVAVQNSENGTVRISVQAMDTLVKHAIGEAEGIVDIKTSIINHEDSISVNIEMTLESDVHIPNVTMLMQRSIKNFIEEFSGIAVREVTVMVGKIIEVTPLPPLALEEGETKPEAVAEVEPEAVEPMVEPEPAPAFELEPEPTPEPDLSPDPEFEPEPSPETEAEPDDGDGDEAQTDEQEDFLEKDIW